MPVWRFMITPERFLTSLGLPLSVRKFDRTLRATLWIFGLGFAVQVHAASIQFGKVYLGAAASTAASDEPPTITITTPILATFTFTSADPAALLFSGNDVAGTLSGGGSSYIGVISRRSKTGNTSDAFYFYETAALGNDAPLVGGSNLLLIVPSREALTSDNSTVGISSDTIDDALNDLLPTNTAPVNTVPGPQTVNEDTPLSFSASNSNLLSSSDTNLASVTLTVNHGTLTVTPGSATLSAGASGSASITLSGAATAINAALASVVYQGAANYFGTDTLTMISRDSVLSDTDTVSITINPVNDAPSFTKGADQTVSEDAGAQTISNWILAASTGPANESAQSLSYSVSNNNSAVFTVGGQPAIAANGTLTFTPAANASGTATVSVKILDDGGTANGGINESAVQTFAITVAAANDAPAGTDATLTTAQNAAYTFAASNFGFSDPNDSPPDAFFSVKITTLPLSGELRLNNVPVTAGQEIPVADISSLAYVPNDTISGNAAATFTFQVRDSGTGNSLDPTPNTLTFNLTAVNRPPELGRLANGNVDPAYNAGTGRYEITTPEDTPVSGRVNAFDRDGDSLAFSLASRPANGTAVLNSDGSYTYTPNANFNGRDSFTVLVSDGRGGTALVTVFITVTPVNDPPIPGQRADGSADPAYNTASQRYEITTPEDTPVSGRVQAYDVDGDPLTYSAGTAPTNGTVVINRDGSYTYTPKADYHGTDRFTVIVSDGQGGMAVITVFVTITPVNDAPVAGRLANGTIDHAYNASTGRYENSTNQDTPVSGRVRAFDADGDTLTFTVKDGPRQGALTLNPDGGYTYTPAPGFHGEDSFRVTISDGKGGMTEVTVFLRVYAVPVNTLPNGPFSFTGDAARVAGADGSVFKVADADSAELTVRLRADRGFLTLPERSGLTVVEGSAFNDSTVVIKGPLAALNAALAQLQYQAPGGFVGRDTITIISTDERGSSDTDRIDPPFTVELATLGGRDVSASIGTLTPAGTEVSSVRVVSFDASVITGADIVGSGADARLQLGTPTRQDGSVQKTKVTVEVLLANGTKESFELKVTVYNPKLEVITSLSLNPQTSLFEQKVQITNTTPYQIDSLRVMVPSLPGGVTLYSRHTVASDGSAIIDDTRGLAPGGSRVFVVEYFSPNLSRFTEPALKLAVNGAGPVSAPIGTIAAVDRVLVGTNNRTYVEFTTLAGRNYWIQYRDGANGLWLTSPSPVSGTGATLHWLDEGMPKTATAPTATREYRLVVATATATLVTIVSHPASVRVVPGAAARLQVAAAGSGPFTYQWYRDGVALTGATAATLDIARASLSDEGDYAVTVSDGRSSLQSRPAVVTLASNNPGRIVNLAVRASIDASETPLITGFVLEGSGSRTLLTRAVGETLSRFGVSPAVRDPALKLYRGSALLAENDDWNSDLSADLTRASTVSAGAFTLAENSKDAGLLRRLIPSAYTLHTANKSDATGAVLVEIYDSTGTYDASNRIVNVSTRTRISGRDGALIAGFVIGGETSCRVLARVVGPTLSTLGVNGSLADPTLTLYRAGTEAAIATNDDWGTAGADGLFARVGAFELPNGSKDAVVALRLPPGAYTLVAQGKGAADGQALVEIYLVR
jgi:VCBS repeat-containing protein